MGIDQLQKSQKELPWWKDLPFSYSDLVVAKGSRPEGFCFSQHIVNIEATFDGTKLAACGEANTESLAMTKAIAELMERSGLHSWNKSNPQRKKSSNGWAAHLTAESARRSAIFEVIERDAVLAQWYSATPFYEIENDDLPLFVREWRENELSKSELPELRVLLSTQGLGPSVTCIFMNKEGFGVSSHATRDSLTESIESAVAETCRAAHLYLRKAFWKDSLTLMNGGTNPIQLGAHAVYYAYREPFPSWMFGRKLSLKASMEFWDKMLSNCPLDEFSFYSVLDDQFCIGFAHHPKVFQPIWGVSDVINIQKMAASTRLSATTTEWNLKPHIIS